MTQAKSEILLRQLISEMAWAGSLGTMDGVTTPRANKKGLKAAKKIARSSLFEKLASQLFGNMPLKVWTAAYIGKLATYEDLVDADLGFDRAAFIPLNDEGMKILIEKFKFDSSKISQIDPDNDVVIVYGSEIEGGLGLMATPWMIMHAIIDSIAFFRMTGQKNIASELFNHFDYKDLTKIVRILYTMRSAKVGRTAEIGKNEIDDDVITSEPVVQQLIDKRRFNFAHQLKPGPYVSDEKIKLAKETWESLTPAQQKALVDFQSSVKQTSKFLLQTLKGKLVIVDVSATDG